MKFSVVTISFNQAKYLSQCMESVLGQNYEDVEYIVVDAGSTDGSREIIESYGDKVTRVFERDAGPADGLNKGFSAATGDVFYFLNSDDVLLPGAIARAARAFSDRVDVVHAHAQVIDGEGDLLRLVYSDIFNIEACGYGSCIIIQPSAFFRKSSFEAAGGFNTENRSNWDGELFLDMGLAGARFVLLDEILSSYRVYAESITGSGKFQKLHAEHRQRMYEKVFKFPYSQRSRLVELYFKNRRRIVNIRDTYQRITKGPVFMAGGQ